MDYDSVVNTIAAAGTIVALVFATRADMKADRAMRLSVEQGRKTFELELLRQLADVLRRVPDDEWFRQEARLSHDAGSDEFNRRYRYIFSQYLYDRGGHLLAMTNSTGVGGLKTWEAVRMGHWNVVEETVFPDKETREKAPGKFAYRHEVEKYLQKELLEAIEARTS